MICSTSRNRILALIAVVAAAAAFGRATRSFGQTSVQACLDKAWADANSCYVAAGDSWFKGKLCDLKLEYRLVQCFTA